MSQATCKVCQNKIVIRKPPEGTPADEIVSAPGIPIPASRSPMPTPTRVSPLGAAGDEMEPTVADPLPASARPSIANAPSASAAAPLPSEGSGISSLPEQELSNSWREAIVDNRATIAMLKKQGVSGPSEGSTASGPAVTAPIGGLPPAPAPPPFATVAPPPPADPVPVIANAPPPPAPEKEKPLELATGRTGNTITSVQQNPVVPTSRVPSPPRPFVKEGSSQLLSLATGVAASAIVAAQLWNGSWGAGLSGWLSFGAASFVATAALLNALLKGPGFGAVFGVGFVASLVALAAMLGVFLTGGARTRVIADSHPFLAPLAKFEIHLAKGLPVATPEAAPDAAETPLAAGSPVPEATAAPSPTP